MVQYIIDFLGKGTFIKAFLAEQSMKALYIQLNIFEHAPL
jgi:hypothetical protein